MAEIAKGHEFSPYPIQAKEKLAVDLGMLPIAIAGVALPVCGQGTAALGILAYVWST